MIQLKDIYEVYIQMIERTSSKWFYDGQVFYDQVEYRKRNLKKEVQDEQTKRFSSDEPGEAPGDSEQGRTQFAKQFQEQ